MHFQVAPDSDAEVRRVTDSEFGLKQDETGVYLVFLKTGKTAQIMLPVPSDFDFKKVASLSSRERQVFELLGEGRTLKDISSTLALSVKTAETYRARIKQKLEVADGLSVVRLATAWTLLYRADVAAAVAEKPELSISGSPHTQPDACP